MQADLAMCCCQPAGQALDKQVRPRRTEQLADGDAVFRPHRCAGAHAAHRGIARQHRDARGARHAHAHGMGYATRAQRVQPRQDDVGIKRELRDDDGRHAALDDAVALAFQHLPLLGCTHHRMAFRVAGHADHPHACAFEDAGVDQRGTVGKRPHRGGGIARDHEAACDVRFGDRALDEGRQLGERGDAARGKMRHGFKAESAHGPCRSQPRGVVLAWQVGNGNGGCGQYPRRRRAQRGNILRTDFQGIAMRDVAGGPGRVAMRQGACHRFTAPRQWPAGAPVR